MRKLLMAAVCVLALTTAGLAVGKGLQGAKTMKAVAGTFSATTGKHVDKKTCTTSDGKTLVSSHGKYTGTASGDPDFTDPVTVDVHSLVNTTDEVGVVSGKLKIDVASGKDTILKFDAVYDHDKLAGLARGHAHDPGMQLLANLSGGYDADGGFTDAKLGGTDGGSAVAFGPGKCAPSKPDHEKKDKPEKAEKPKGDDKHKT